MRCYKEEIGVRRKVLEWWNEMLDETVRLVAQYWGLATLVKEHRRRIDRLSC
jgi:hypothetical protein